MKLSRTKKDFFETLIYFSKASYTQKIEYMKENWGNIASEMTVSYDGGCNITIRIDSLKKYHFDFECKEINLEEFAANLPDYAEFLFENGEDCLKESFPEIQEFYVRPIEDLDTTQIVEEAPEDMLVAQEQKIEDFSYINFYNGIKINKK